jgi:hypothetical protein
MIFRKRLENKLNRDQLQIVFSDLVKTVNYFCSSGDEKAYLIDGGIIYMLCWGDMPGFIENVHIIPEGDSILLEFKVNRKNTSLEEVAYVLNRYEVIISNIIGYEVKNYFGKVFCIGWPKTGTTSITQALRNLGLFSWHFSPWIIGCKSQDQSLDELKLDLEFIEMYSSFSDLPICLLYEDLDKMYPGSKFILTVRDEESWIKSALAHHKNGLYVNTMAKLAYKTDGLLTHDIMLERYRSHNVDVLKYFHERDDFLVLSLDDNMKWNKICHFLGVSEPDFPFPIMNARK